MCVLFGVWDEEQAAGTSGLNLRAAHWISASQVGGASAFPGGMCEQTRPSILLVNYQYDPGSECACVHACVPTETRLHGVLG